MPCSTKLSSNKNVKSNLKLTPDNLDYTTLYVLTEFRTESLVWVSERRLMVRVSGLKRVLSKAYIALGWPVFLRCYCGLVDHG